MSLDRSLVRYALMGLLVYQGAVASTLALVVPFLSLSLAQTLMGAMAVALFFGCVLVVPFHPLKRGLHDLLAGTIVIRGAMPDPVWIAARMNPRRDHRIVGGAVALAMAAVLARHVGWPARRRRTPFWSRWRAPASRSLASGPSVLRSTSSRRH